MSKNKSTWPNPSVRVESKKLEIIRIWLAQNKCKGIKPDSFQNLMEPWIDEVVNTLIMGSKTAVLTLEMEEKCTDTN